MNSEPANFLNNGKAFPSMKWHAAASVLTSFSFFHDTGKPKGIGFLRPSKTEFIRK